MTPEERAALMNEVYSAVYSLLVNYELRRGFNAHSRAQSITQRVVSLCEEWIELQKDPTP